VVWPWAVGLLAQLRLDAEQAIREIDLEASRGVLATLAARRLAVSEEQIVPIMDAGVERLPRQPENVRCPKKW
jgi:hypothetical protein